MLTFARTSLPVLAVVAVLAAPATAHAEPTVAYPTRAAIATGTPSFQVTNDASGRVNGIFVSSTSKLNSTGTLENANASDNGESIYGMPFESSVVRMSRPIYAGTHYWMYSWLPVTADGTTGEVRRSSVRDFTMVAIIKAVKAGAIYQDATRPTAGVTGTFVSNVRKSLKVTCRVTKGTKTIVTQTRPNLVSAPMAKTSWACLQMRVPESYDGAKLKLTVTVTGDGKSATTSKLFTAK